MSEHPVIHILRSVLELGDRGKDLDRDSPLLGALPEFDSMAVLSVLQAIEEHYGFFVGDDEVDASTFETVGTLMDFVDSKLSG